ncbi:hypothetical protein B9479_000170 [Cryptococcus floricola]|uniref:Uncharacterized protein n=1 Tax=Cryptococcus floricola TaxID=2591691 RepID=A0A5D3B978_9TREE|nr:hypothetical protein B9479_000170 [Cryptococcus floricola]
MYWYISFLRPPPVATANPAQGITITPQVANDLRTELRYEPTTISYLWQRLVPATSPPTPPTQLTIFEPPASTYKPITIPLPPLAKVGESWRLGLFSSGASSKARGAEAGPSGKLLDLVQGPQILGVWSEGIQIIRPSGSGLTPGAVRGMGKQKETQPSSGAKGKNIKGNGKGKPEKDEGAKQGRIIREWALPENEGSLRIVEQTSFDLDKKIWDSGLALSAWLWKYLPDPSTLPSLGQRVLSLLTREEQLSILELGTGTGLVSIVLALALRRRNLGREITATDLDSAIPLMDENIALNPIPPQPQSTEQANAEPEVSPKVTLDAKVLDWDQPLPDWVVRDMPELVIAADVTYNTDSFPALLSTLTCLLTPPKDEKHPLLILAYKQRDLAERDLWEMLKEKGIGMVLIDKVQGAEEGYGETEIWVGGYGLKA